MTVHFFRDMEKLKKEVLTMGGMVEEATNKAIIALEERRMDLAEDVLEGDSLIDNQEIATEEECLKILALHQPVARDLRFIISVMKVNNALEEMGDKAGNIASNAIKLAAMPPLRRTLDLVGMCEKVRSMVQDCLNALVEEDVEKAREIIRRDKEVDDMREAMTSDVRELLKEDPSCDDRAFPMLDVIRHLERIGDFASEIAEDVVFMVEGVIVRHSNVPLQQRG